MAGTQGYSEDFRRACMIEVATLTANGSSKEAATAEVARRNRVSAASIRNWIRKAKFNVDGRDTALVGDIKDSHRLARFTVLEHNREERDRIRNRLTTLLHEQMRIIEVDIDKQQKALMGDGEELQFVGTVSETGKVIKVEYKPVDWSRSMQSLAITHGILLDKDAKDRELAGEARGADAEPEAEAQLADTNEVLEFLKKKEAGA